MQAIRSCPLSISRILIWGFALALAAPAVLADGDCSFTLTGIVRGPTCLPASDVDPVRPACEIWLESTDEGETFYTGVDCSDPGIIEACRALQEGDPALILGVEGPPRWGSSSKRATHVGLWLPSAPNIEGIEEQLPEARIGPTGEYLDLAFGQTVAYRSLRIRFSELIEDSRCPIDVDCVWQGRCSIQIEVWEKEFLGSFVLSFGEDPIADAEIVVAGYKIRFEELFPVPGTPDRIMPAFCSIILWVEKVDVPG